MSQPEILTDEEIESRVRESLIKDFDVLYVPQFSTTWEVERICRETEIDVMSFTNTVKAIRQLSLGYISREQHEREMREQVEKIFDKIKVNHKGTEYGATYEYYWAYCQDIERLEVELLTPNQKKEEGK